MGAQDPGTRLLPFGAARLLRAFDLRADPATVRRLVDAVRSARHRTLPAAVCILALLPRPLLRYLTARPPLVSIAGLCAAASVAGLDSDPDYDPQVSR